MHFVHVTKPGPFRLAPDETYLMDDKPSGQYLMMGFASEVWHTSTDPDAACFINRRYSPEIPDFLPDYTEVARLLIIRAGGLGDLLMISPSLARLQHLYPDMQITVATTSGAAVTLPGIRVIQYPVPADVVDQYDLIIPLEGYIEDNNETDGATIFAQALGLLPPITGRDALRRVPLPSEASTDPANPASSPPTTVNFPLKPLYHADPHLIQEALTRWPHDPRYKLRIGIQIRASADNRTYPTNLLSELIEEHLLPLGAQIFLFANPSQQKIPAEQMHPQIVNLPNLQDPPSFALSAALITTLDLVIAPDSAICHVAGALDIPTVALFGPFHWRQRTSHSPSVHALQGHTPCSPCHHHGWAGDPYPSNQECAQKKYCLSLATLTPTRIAAKTKQLLERKVGTPAH